MKNFASIFYKNLILAIKSIHASNLAQDEISFFEALEVAGKLLIERSKLGADLQLIQMPAGDLEYTKKILKTLLD